MAEEIGNMGDMAEEFAGMPGAPVVKVGECGGMIVSAVVCSVRNGKTHINDLVGTGNGTGGNTLQKTLPDGGSLQATEESAPFYDKFKPSRTADNTYEWDDMPRR